MENQNSKLVKSLSKEELLIADRKIREAQKKEYVPYEQPKKMGIRNKELRRLY